MTAPLWTSSAIATATGTSPAGQWTVSGISIDSRTVEKGDLFIALKGPQFDGHDFVHAAFSAGASGALVSRPVENCDASTCILVPDTYDALIQLGAAGRARAQAKIIGVTGSVGKTGCKEALRQVLGAQAETYANVGSFNNHWGVPLSLSRLPISARFGIFELGMNHVGELGPLARQVQPHIVLITTIAAVHIGNFNSLDEIAQAKAEIFEGLAPGGHAVLNADNAYYDYLASAAAKRRAHIHGFGRHASAAAQLLDCSLAADNSAVKARILGRTVNYTVGAPGEHWVMNSLAVLLSAALAGADIEKAAATLGHLSLAEGRGAPEMIKATGGTFTLIDESYNASPLATEMAIKVLGRKTPSGQGRRLLALGDMRELGEHARTAHSGLSSAIEAAGIDLVFCCGEHMKHLYEALPEKRRGGWAFTSSELAPLVSARMMAGDIITIKGSKSMAMAKVCDALRALSLTPTIEKRTA